MFYDEGGKSLPENPKQQTTLYFKVWSKLEHQSKHICHYQACVLQFISSKLVASRFYEFLKYQMEYDLFRK
jgi:hypothetical protein